LFLKINFEHSKHTYFLHSLQWWAVFMSKFGGRNCRLLHFDLFLSFTFKILEKYPQLLNVYHSFFGFPIIVSLCSDWIVFTLIEMNTFTVICVILMIFFFVIFPEYTPDKLMRSLVISTANKNHFVWSHFKMGGVILLVI
jgi:hypothetical protein